MVNVDLKKVVGNQQTEEKGILSGMQKTWNARSSRPNRMTVLSFVGILIVLQTLVLCRFFWGGYSGAAGPPYNATETVELVTAYYELLREMRYIGSDSIAYPPHVGAKAINITAARRLGIDDRVIETLQLLPYLIPHEDRLDNLTGYDLRMKHLQDVHKDDPFWYLGWMGLSRDVLWRNGHFIDYRDTLNLYAARDPLKSWQERWSEGASWEDEMLQWGSYPKSAFPLSIAAPMQSALVLLLDTASNRMVVMDTQGGGNSDWFFDQFEWNKIPKLYRIPKSLFHGETVHARLANDFFRDLIIRTQTLETDFIPGSVRSDPHYTPELSPPHWQRWVQKLYIDHGWPRGAAEECQYLAMRQGNSSCHFDPMAHWKGQEFDVAIKELRHNITVKYLPDWYCPVPRRADLIDRLISYGKLENEQVEYARSNESVIPLNLEGWGGNLVFMQYD